MVNKPALRNALTVGTHPDGPVGNAPTVSMLCGSAVDKPAVKKVYNLLA